MGKKLLNRCLMAIMMVVSMSAYALDKVNGVYQIGTAEDLKAFAELVNGGEKFANAVLTADINKGTDETKIGKGLDYQGVFDGAGHTITINLFTPEKDNEGAALFRNVGNQAIIKRLKVQGTIQAATLKHAAAIANYSSGIICDCYVDLHISAAYTDSDDASCGGIVGQCGRAAVLENCLAKIKITGTATHKCGGLVAWADDRTNIVNCLVLNDPESNFNWSDGKSAGLARNNDNLFVVDLDNYNTDSYKNRPKGACYNNYVTNNWGLNNKATTVVNAEDLASGKICYQLNNDQSRIAWVQDIGDPFPVPAIFGKDKGMVYASVATDCSGKASGEVTYSNSGSDTAAKHTFDKYGVCTTCGCFNFNCFDFDDPTRYDPTDKSFLLSSGDDFFLVEGWNRLQNGCKFNLKMMNDIECISEPGQLIFNSSDWIESCFNGQGHQLTIEMVDVNEQCAALFPRPYAYTRDYVFENVILHGKISTKYTSASPFAASIGGYGYRGGSNKMIIRNVFSDVEIDVKRIGDNTSAGLLAVANYETKIENCIYAGDVIAPEGGECIAGLCGWANASTTTLTNCAFLGTLTNPGGDSRTISRNYGSQTLNNVYSINEYGDGKDEHTYIKYTNTDGITNGELAFFLNGKVGGVERFYQKIGVDDYPMPVKKEGALVYTVAKSYRCDGQPLGDDLTFTNNPSSITIPPHTYVDGWCSVCEDMQEDFMAPVDGWFEISTPGQFLWWSVYASTHLDASARLTADIDLKNYLAEDKATGEEYTKHFAQIGSEYNPFYGNFDGQHHIISNLRIFLPGKRGCGLISVMNSQPESGFGGLSADAARAAEGVYVKDVVLDETCSIYGGGYTGIVGMGAPWAGHITITGCMNLGNVHVDSGTNGAGIYGCSMSSACRITIDACGMIGNITVTNDTRTENGSFSGWLGDYAEVTNCFALGTVDYIDANRGFARHPGGAYNSGKVVIKNCYALDGIGIKQVDDGDKQEDVSFVSMDELETGSVTWKANGYQFRNPVWYQNVGEDMYPYPDSSHGNVIYVADEYFTINEETLPDVISVIVGYYNDQPDDFVAYTGAIEDYHNKIEALEDVTTVIGLADAMDSISASIAVIEASVEVYKQYEAKCEEVKTYLEEHDDLVGPDRDALEAYLNEDYIIIMEEHELPDSVIQQEIVRVEEWLALAIKNGAVEPGRDLTSLFANADFHKDFKEGWTSSTGQYPNGTSTVTIDGRSYYGSEAWNTKFDIHQTVKGLKPGYYLVGLQGAFRPSNNRYSYNYVAQVYANNNVNYLQTVIEDYVSVNDANNGQNVYLSQFGGGNTTYDLPIYEDGYSTNDDNGSDVIGYVIHGPSGVAVAGYAGRYKNYIIAKTEGDSLTIGVNNLGTNYGNDWTGFSSFNVIYAGEGEEAEEYVTTALESMLARANNILNIYRSDEIMELMEGEAEYPNYPVELKEALETAVAAADAATGTEAKMKAVETLSQLFKDFYEARQAYLALHKAASILETVESNNTLSLVKKNDAGEWEETGDFLLSLAETDALYEIYDQMFAGYEDGSYSTEEAKEAATLRDPAISALVPPLDEDGYYLISTPKQFAAFRAIVGDADEYAKAKLTTDIDMTGIAMRPIGGILSDGGDAHFYRGKFDGQNHAITNLYISEDYTYGSDTQTSATLFYEIKGTTIKNLKITGEYFNTKQSKFMGGLSRWASEGNTVDNVEIEVVMHAYNSGDGTHGGVFGVCNDNTVVSNCLVNVTMLGEGENPTTNCAGVCGWGNSNFTINNTLILSQYQNIIKGDNSNVVGRNGYTANNVFYVERSNPGFETGGTLVSDAQLASGEICWKLNGSTADNAHWFQKLGEDATPHLFSGSRVWKNGDEYQNRIPNNQLNAFASNLSTATNTENVVVAYTLNAEAKSGAINFYVGDELKYAHVLKDVDLMAGNHEVAVENSLLGVPAGTKMTYALDITGVGTKMVTKIGDSYKVWGPYGMVINNNPASKGFGQVLMVESYPQEIKDTYISHDKPGALYAFDVNFQPIKAADGTPGFYGGLSIKGEEPLAIAGTYRLDLRDIRFTADGRLFVARASGLDPSSVYEINPEDLNEAWKPVFKGGILDQATGITYVGDQEQNRMALSLAFEGKGDDLKMYVLGGQRSNGDNNVTDYNCSVYNLGTATEWTGVPSANYEPLDGVYTYTSVDVSIYEDGQGGLWFIQNRNTEANPAQKHFDATGKEDYSSLVSTGSGKMAMTSDGKYLAIPKGSGQIGLYETDYVPMANNRIFLNPITTINVSETRITALAFDYANNLYVASAGSETLSRYAIPSWNGNKSVTPSAEGFVVGTESGDPDAIKSVNPAFSNVEGTIYNMAGQRVSRAQKGVYVVEGKKTLVK